MRYRPPTIESQGLKAYLNSTKEKHDGCGYDEFVRFVGRGVNTTNIALIFNVNRHTATRWLQIYRAERGME